MTKDLSFTDFEPLVGETFTVRFPDGTVELVLTEAVSRGVGVRAAGAFSLTFTGPPHLLMPQYTYRLEQAGLGEFDIFLVPEAQSETARTYVAVFA